jgi:hypothetical protein
LANQFNIRPPEDVAFAYGFDKSKIAEAVANKTLDETSAVIAAMWLNAGQRQQEMQVGQQPTVAQQAFASPAPQQPPMGAPAGLGATPQAMGAAPQMDMPQQEMPMMAEGGMVPPYASGGGLSDVPLPDGMFDEPSNGGFGDGYAGGGMVAFADGGGVDLERFRKAIIAQESGGDYGVMNAEGSGAMGAYQFMPPTARALAARLGLPYRPELLQGAKGRSKEGRAYQDALGTAQLQDALKFGKGDIGKAGAYHFAGPNKAGHGPKTRKYEQDILRRYSGSKEGSEMMPERNIGTAEGRGMSYEDSAALAGRLLKDPEEYAQAKEEARARFAEMRSPEEYEKQRKGDMWQTLAEIGFNMASSKAPSVLQAIGEAAAAAMPGARADRKERKALKDRALDGLLKLGAEDRAQAKEVLSLGTDIFQTGLKQEQFDQELALRGSELDARKEEAAKKSPEEQLIDTYYQQFLTAGDTPARAYQKAMFAAKNLLERAKPKEGNSAQTNDEKLKKITGAGGADGGEGEFKYLGTEG